MVSFKDRVKRLAHDFMHRALTFRALRPILARMSTPVQVNPVDGVIEEIRVAMARRRWRQADLARAIGEAEPWVSRRLNGKAEITVGELFRFAEALKVPVQALLPQGNLHTAAEHRCTSRRAGLAAPRQPIRRRLLAIAA